MAYTKTPQPCGTKAAAMRHRRAGEPPCDPCRAAEAAAVRSYYKPRPRKRARHFTVSMYTLGCRCNGCKEAWAEYQREWRVGKRRRRQTEKAWTLRDDILDFLQLEGWATVAEIAERFNRHPDSVERVLRKLRKEGLVVSKRVELGLDERRISMESRLEWRTA